MDTALIAPKFSRERLGRMNEIMASHVERGTTPGLITAVSRKGETHVEVMGSMEIGGAPLQRDSIFRIASMSKPITAVAALILLEECVLRLDEPVDRLLPELADRQVLRSLESEATDTVPANRAITLRDLLTFTFGQGLVFAWPGTYPIQTAIEEAGLGPHPPQPASDPEPDEWMRRLGTLPLIYQPGERWLYNTGSDVLSVLIARASGQDLETFMGERIFDPLGMKDTGFSVSAENIDRLTTNYGTNFETGALELYDAAEGGAWSTAPAFPSGAGGLVSTIDDYLAFAQMLLNGGKLGNTRILSRPTVELMTTNQLTPEQRVSAGFLDQGWGFGVAMVLERRDVIPVGAYGWDGGLGTTWRNDPAEDLISIMLTEASWTSSTPPAICRDFWTTAYASLDD